MTARVRCPLCGRKVAVLSSGRLSHHKRFDWCRDNGHEPWVCEGAGADATLPLAIERAQVAREVADEMRREIAERVEARDDVVDLHMSLAQQKITAYDAATQRERDALAAQEREIADAEAALAALRGAP